MQAIGMHLDVFHVQLPFQRRIGRQCARPTKEPKVVGLESWRRRSP
jgi:hypothetical protein